MSAVRTVLGDIAPAELGVTDAHDHLSFRSPQLPGRELADASAARAELDAFRAAGGRSVVQWTPYGLGRRAADLPLLSRAAGASVVCATGLHQAVHYDPEELTALRGPARRGLRLRTHHGDRPVGGPGRARQGRRRLPRPGRARPLDDDSGGRGPPRHGRARRGPPRDGYGRAGCAGPAVRRAGDAAAPGDPRAPRPLPRPRGAARGGTERLLSRLRRGPSRTHHATAWRMPGAVRALAEAGFGHRLLLGGDTVVAGARSVDGGPGMPYLLRRLRPRLAAALGADLVDRILQDNPAGAFAADGR